MGNCNENPSAPIDESQENRVYRKYTMNDEDEDEDSRTGCCGNFCISCKGCLFTIFECMFLVF
ncbi:unnamed protein product [Orchesella dallaii]|uniref:Uncharacterized protein n=1 Tax=Orchesella dallaii TaxID=48710 RepID=A0ABP1Q904_9HEXA